MSSESCSTIMATTHDEERVLPASITCSPGAKKTSQNVHKRPAIMIFPWSSYFFSSPSTPELEGNNGKPSVNHKLGVKTEITEH